MDVLRPFDGCLEDMASCGRIDDAMHCVDKALGEAREFQSRLKTLMRNRESHDSYGSPCFCAECVEVVAFMSHLCVKEGFESAQPESKSSGSQLMDLEAREHLAYIKGWNDGVRRAHGAANEGLEQNWHPQEILNNVEDQFRRLPIAQMKVGK